MTCFYTINSPLIRRHVTAADGDLDVPELLHKLVDCHQDGLAERWAGTLDVEMQVRSRFAARGVSGSGSMVRGPSA